MMQFALSEGVVLRSLRADDTDRLAAYFEALTPATTTRFQPHPLTREQAGILCGAVDGAVDGAESVLRLVLEHDNGVIGYFILELTVRSDDAARYAAQGITLEAGRDLLFAPSVADAWQDRGLSSLALPHLIALARQAGARSLVLMGGTQATNARAIRFYEKFGFEHRGGYQTGVWNHDMRLLIND
jgi:GNAT superfamily N-acetyltransferase